MFECRGNWRVSFVQTLIFVDFNPFCLSPGGIERDHFSFDTFFKCTTNAADTLGYISICWGSVSKFCKV